MKELPAADSGFPIRAIEIDLTGENAEVHFAIPASKDRSKVAAVRNTLLDSHLFYTVPDPFHVPKLDKTGERNLAEGRRLLAEHRIRRFFLGRYPTANPEDRKMLDWVDRFDEAQRQIAWGEKPKPISKAHHSFVLMGHSFIPSANFAEKGAQYLTKVADYMKQEQLMSPDDLAFFTASIPNLIAGKGLLLGGSASAVSK